VWAAAGRRAGTAGSGYTVSGTVSYTGSKTGQIYLVLSGACIGGSLGTKHLREGSIYDPRRAAGFFTLYAYMDTVGYGNQNAADPSTSNPGSFVNVTTSNLTGQNVTLTDPATATVTSAPTLTTVSPCNGGVVAQYSAIMSSSVETQPPTLCSGALLQRLPPSPAARRSPLTASTPISGW